MPTEHRESDNTAELIASLRGHVSSLRGEIKFLRSQLDAKTVELRQRDDLLFALIHKNLASSITSHPSDQGPMQSIEGGLAVPPPTPRARWYPRGFGVTQWSLVVAIATLAVTAVGPNRVEKGWALVVGLLSAIIGLIARWVAARHKSKLTVQSPIESASGVMGLISAGALVGQAAALLVLFALIFDGGGSENQDNGPIVASRGDNSTTVASTPGAAMATQEEDKINCTWPVRTWEQLAALIATPSTGTDRADPYVTLTPEERPIVPTPTVAPTPFVLPKNGVLPEGPPPDDKTMIQTSVTIDQLIECNAAGDYQSSLAVFSDNYVRREILGSTLVGRTFPDFVFAAPGDTIRQSGERTLPDGRVGFIMEGLDQDDRPHYGSTAFIIVMNDGERWLIDEVVPLDTVGMQEP